jgi:hypothetical protein
MKHILFLMLLAAPAESAELVLYGPGETPSTASAKTALLAGRAPADLVAHTLTGLVSGTDPAALGGATVQTCPGDTGSNAAIALILEKTASAVLFMEIETANAGLGAVLSMERCLTEVLDPAIISQVHYLRGMVAVGSGNQAEAWPEFLQAAILNPEIQWDENYPPDGKGAFTGAVAAVKAAAPISLRLLPPPPGKVWVDGKAAEDTANLSLVPGTHVIQVEQSEGGLVTYTVSLPEGSDTSLVFADALTDEHISLVQSPDTRGLLEGLLTTHGQGNPAFVSLPGQTLWQFDPGARTWSALAGGEESAAVAEPVAAAAESDSKAALPGTSGNGKRRRLTLAGGGGLVVTGGVLLGMGLGERSRFLAGDVVSLGDVDSIMARANKLGGIGMASAAVGVGLLGVGVLTTSSSVTVSVGGRF